MKTEKEFNLSKKIYLTNLNFPSINSDILFKDDVKEFIRLLKETFEKWGLELQKFQITTEDNAILGKMECPKCREYFTEMIDELAGDKLI